MKQTFRDLEAIFADRTFMKKILVYILVFVFQFTLIFVIATILEVEPENYLYALVAVSILSLTIAVFFIRIVRDYKDKHPIVKGLRMYVGIIIFILLVAWTFMIYYLVTGEMIGNQNLS